MRYVIEIALPAASLALVAGCSDKRSTATHDVGGTTTDAATTQPDSRSPAASAALPSASATEKGGAHAALAGTYTGAYKARVSTVSDYPKEAKVAAWEKDLGTEAVGDGTITLVVTPGHRTVSGETKGALGAQTISGDLEGAELRARVDPKRPNTEPAMTGVLSGTFATGAFTGTLRVSGRNANVVREAEVKLSRAP